jgi:alpha-mannosidase
VIARVYEAAGEPAANVKIHFSGRIAEPSEVNLMEDKIQSMASQNNSIHFDLRPFEIKTFRLQLTSETP